MYGYFTISLNILSIVFCDFVNIIVKFLLRKKDENFYKMMELFPIFFVYISKETKRQQKRL